jgi:hypothetical protein
MWGALRNDADGLFPGDQTHSGQRSGHILNRGAGFDLPPALAKMDRQRKRFVLNPQTGKVWQFTRERSLPLPDFSTKPLRSFPRLRAVVSNEMPNAGPGKLALEIRS